MAFIYDILIAIGIKDYWWLKINEKSINVY